MICATDGAVTAFALPPDVKNAFVPTKLWRTADLPAACTPVAYDGILYVATVGGALATVSMQTGAVMQQTAMAGQASETVIAGHCLYLSGMGKEHRGAILSLGARPSVRWEYRVEDAPFALSFLGRDQFVLTAGRLYAIGGRAPAEKAAVNGPPAEKGLFILHG